MKQVFLGITGVLACPCHMPLYLALLGGTAFGGTLAAYSGWMFLVMGIVFGAIVIAFISGRSLTPVRDRSCAVPNMSPEVTHEPTTARKT